jgi:hypothetical protein
MTRIIISITVMDLSLLPILLWKLQILVPAWSCGSIASPRYYRQVILTSSPLRYFQHPKSYNLWSGMRLGFASGPRPIIEAIVTHVSIHISARSFEEASSNGENTVDKQRKSAAPRSVASDGAQTLSALGNLWFPEALRKRFCLL